MTSVATFNMGDGPDRDKLRDLHHLADVGATVIGCQEGSDRRNTIARFLDERPGWRSWQPDAPGAAAVPILWDATEWKRLRLRTRLAVAARWVGPRGAGPTRAKAKRVNIAVLRHHDTGKAVRFLDTHPIPSTGRDLGPAENEARDDHYADHIRVVARIARHGSRVVLFADLNAEQGDPQLRPLHDAGLTGWSHDGTLRGRAVDHVLTRGVVATSPLRFPTSSDHVAVIRLLRLERS